MNLLGEPFSPFVKKQVEIRQKVLGKSSDVLPKDLQFYTTKTPFLRAASSVFLSSKGSDQKEIENSVLKRLVKAGVPEEAITGNNLADNFILQGGVTDLTIDKGNVNFGGLKSGLNDGTSLFNGAYGWGGTAERGFVPMPGIINCDIQYYGNGAFFKTVLNVKCFSKQQFQLLDVLYLRPGYTVLVEFGWSQYLTNPNDNGDYELINFPEFTTEPMRDFLRGGSSQFEIGSAIQKEREKHYGNYDAIFGKISKFGWTFNKDGSYDCQIQLTSMGSLIESLKCNITNVALTEVEKKAAEALDAIEAANEEVTGENLVPPLIGNATATKINKELYRIYQSTRKATKSKGDAKYVGELDYVVKNFRDEKGKKPFDLKIKNGIIYRTGITTDDNTQNPQTYIKYGAFLAYVQSQLLLYNTQTQTPIVVFDFDFEDLDNDDNYILHIPGQISTDPRVCLMPYQAFVTKNSKGEAIGFEKTAVNDVLTRNNFFPNPSTTKLEAQYVGRIANLYLNVNFLATLLESFQPDKEGNIALLGFLKSINSQLISVTGGINDYDFKLDQSGLKIQIIEEIPQRFTEQTIREQQLEFTRFNVYGVKPGIEGSFVRDISLNAELSPQFASMIAIGAQSSGNQIGTNATTFSNYNAGLIDRVIQEKLEIDDTDEGTPTTSSAEVISKPDQLSTAIQSQTGSFKSIYNTTTWTSDDISSFHTNMSDSIKLEHGILTDATKADEPPQLQAPFFLPFNLSLEIDGLSGMKLYQKFLMTDDILPPSYERDGVDLQIKGINHSINSDAWTTHIETLSVRKEQLSQIKRPSALKPASPQQQTGASGNLKPPPPASPPEDEKLRLRLTRLMDDGTQTLGYFEVLAEDESTVLYRLATSELPWLGNQNSVSCIPVDKYRVKSHASSKYGNCFWVIGNEGGGYAFNKLFGNGYIRTAVLIHSAPKAPGWLMGCIAPGLKFNEAGKQKGRQKGTGQYYLDPAKSQSLQALAKLADTLHSVGSYRMEIVNNGGVSSENLPKSFDQVKSTMTSLGLLPNPR